jgi:hypothetical protein
LQAEAQIALTSVSAIWQAQTALSAITLSEVLIGLLKLGKLHWPTGVKESTVRLRVGRGVPKLPHSRRTYAFNTVFGCLMRFRLRLLWISALLRSSRTTGIFRPQPELICSPAIEKDRR